jgi:hypothetical protein
MTKDAAPGWVPESCSLPTAEQPLRVAAIWLANDHVIFKTPGTP